MMRGITASLFWVALAYVAALGVPLFILLTLASGYGYPFLGLWEPPHTEQFRAITTICCYASLTICLVVSVIGMIKGVLWSRLALLAPLLFSVGIFGLLLYSWVS